MCTYKMIIKRNDGTILNLSSENLEQAKLICSKYHKKYGYDTQIEETRVIYKRETKRGE